MYSDFHTMLALLFTLPQVKLYDQLCNFPLSPLPFAISVAPIPNFTDFLETFAVSHIFISN
jgi:hypothetical protein